MTVAAAVGRDSISALLSSSICLLAGLWRCSMRNEFWRPMSLLAASEEVHQIKDLGRFSPGAVRHLRWTADFASQQVRADDPAMQADRSNTCPRDQCRQRADGGQPVPSIVFLDDVARRVKICHEEGWARKQHV